MGLDVIYDGARIVFSLLHVQYVVSRLSEHLREGGGADQDDVVALFNPLLSPQVPVCGRNIEVVVNHACEATAVVQSVCQVENVVGKRWGKLGILAVEDKDSSTVCRSVCSCIYI